MPSDYSDRARKAANTRAENIEKERRESERLTEETKQGRSAKQRALACPVWKDHKRQDTHLNNSTDHRDITVEEQAKKKKAPKQKKTLKDSRKNANDDKDYRRHQQSLGAGSDSEHVNSTHSKEPVAAESNSSGEPQAPKITRPLSIAPDNRAPESPSHEQKAQKAQKRSTGKKSVQVHIDSTTDTDTASGTPSSETSSTESEPDLDEHSFAAERANFVSKDSHPRSAVDCLPEDLFAVDDEDVEMVTRTRSLSCAPLPPTSDFGDTSSGYDEGLDGSDDDIRPSQASKPKSRKRPRSSSQLSDVEEFFEKSAKKSQKQSKAKRRRAEAFSSERPVVMDSSTAVQVKHEKKLKTTPKVSADETNSDTDPVWSVSSPLVLINGSKKIKLKDQASVIQDILHRAISKANEDVFFLKTWPEEESRTIYGKGILLNVCDDEELVSVHGTDTISEVKHLLKADAKFTKSLSDLVVGRLSIIRSPAKSEASKFIPFYQLGLGDGCKERVRSLLENFCFHFPGLWGGDSGHEWQPNRKEAFLNPVIVDALRAAYFANPRAIGYRYVGQFSSSLPTKPNEKELPAALLALAMTAVYGCLYEFRNGNHEELDFDGNLFLKANKDIFDLLKKLQDNRPIDFHNRMHQLYKLTINISDEGEASQSSAYDIIDF